jgi:hypothetical protein
MPCSAGRTAPPLRNTGASFAVLSLTARRAAGQAVAITWSMRGELRAHAERLGVAMAPPVQSAALAR